MTSGVCAEHAGAYVLGCAACANDVLAENARLFDLVRYSRAELHDAGLITLKECTYVLAAGSKAAGASGDGPTPARHVGAVRRLEGYDEIRARMDAIERDLRVEWWMNHGCAFASVYGDDG